MTASLLKVLQQSRFVVVLVLHCNHANEIDADVSQALQRLRQAGVTLLNQAVLLKGVNDNSAALIELSRTLFSDGVLPYYLHLLDRVQGAAHFTVTQQQGMELIEDMRNQLPGYLVPRLAQEWAETPAKTIIA